MTRPEKQAQLTALEMKLKQVKGREFLTTQQEIERLKDELSCTGEVCVSCGS